MKPSHRCLLLLLLLVAACGAPNATPTAAPSPAATPSPADIARAAGAQMLSVDTLHFLIALSGKATYLDDPPTLALKAAEGDIARPDRVRATVTLSVLGIIAQIGVVGLGDEQYVTNPLNQQWERVTPHLGWYFNPALFFDPERGIEAVIRGTDWRFAPAGQGAEGGIAVPSGDAEPSGDHHLQAEVDGKSISALTFGMVTLGRVAVDLWVDRADIRVRQIRIVELDSDAQDPTVWLIGLSAFNEPVEIQPPPLP